MTKQDFIDLGITEEQADKAAKKSAEELKGYIPKSRFDETNEARKKAEESLSKRDAELEELKKSNGDNEALKKQIEELQAAQKEADLKYKEELDAAKLNNAIKLAIAGKVHDEEMVAGLFDTGKLILGEDGKVTGLDEQIKSLKENKAFLFKEENNTKPGFHKIGGNPPVNNQETGNGSLKDAIAAHYQV